MHPTLAGLHPFLLGSPARCTFLSYYMCIYYLGSSARSRLSHSHSCSNMLEHCLWPNRWWWSTCLSLALTTTSFESSYCLHLFSLFPTHHTDLSCSVPHAHTSSGLRSTLTEWRRVCMRVPAHPHIFVLPLKSMLRRSRSAMHFHPPGFSPPSIPYLNILLVLHTLFLLSYKHHSECHRCWLLGFKTVLIIGSRECIDYWD